MSRFLACSLVCLLIFVSPARAEGREESLRGLKEVSVLVEELGARAQSLASQGLTESNVKSDVDLKLRKAGFKVWDDPMSKDGRMCPSVLYVNINAHVNPGGLVSYAVHVDLKEPVTLKRNGHSVIATTWDEGCSRICNQKEASSIRKAVSDLVDEFENAWRKANPDLKPISTIYTRP